MCEELGEGKHDQNISYEKISHLKETNWIRFLCRSQSHGERVVGSCPSRDET